MGNVLLKLSLCIYMFSFIPYFKKKEIQSLFSMLQMFNNTILNPRIVLKIKLCKKQADKNIFHLDPFWMNLLKLPPKRLWEHSVVVCTKLFMLFAQLFSLYLSDIHVIFLSIKHIFQTLRKILVFVLKGSF